MKHNLKQLNQDFDEPLLSVELSEMFFNAGYDRNDVEWNDGDGGSVIPVFSAVQWLYINFGVWIGCDVGDDFFVAKVFVKNLRSETPQNNMVNWRLVSTHISKDFESAYSAAIRFCFPLEIINIANINGTRLQV